MTGLLFLAIACTDGSKDGHDPIKAQPGQDTGQTTTDTDMHDSGGTTDTMTDTGTHGDTDSGTMDTAPDECANADELCGMNLDSKIELREDWGASIVTQNSSASYDWSDPEDVAAGIADGGLYPPTPDFPDTSVYPSAYNDATWYLNNWYSWGWCCDVLDWPAEYADPEWITIHHTAGRFDDTAEYVAYVYNFHTYGEGHGWGDIGYQMLVGEDADGTIHHFEGRFSGDTSPSRDPFSSLPVVGACVGGHNTGNTCIATIGDFSTEAPDAATLEALMEQTARTAYEIGLTDTSHIIGHRDWSDQDTECPGDALEALLPEIRDRVTWCQDTCGIVNHAARARHRRNPVVRSSHEEFGD